MEESGNPVQTFVLARFAHSMEKAPWISCRRTGARLGLVFYRAFKRRRTIALDNLRLVFPNLPEAEIRRRACRSAQNFGMSFCEFTHMGAASPQEIAAVCDWDDFEPVERAFNEGHGLLMPTAHFGAWEIIGARIAQQLPLTVMVRSTHNKALWAHTARVRDAVNIKMILKSAAARASLKVLHNGDAMALFPDQHAGPTGELMPLFGHTTRVYTSPARLAYTAKAPMIATYGVRRTPWIEDGRIIIKTYPALWLHRQKWEHREAAVRAGTQYLLDSLEETVLANPEQWLWMHRRWRPQDAADAAAAASADADEASGARPAHTGCHG